MTAATLAPSKVDPGLLPPRAHDRAARVVVITRTFPRLSETFIVDHVRALMRAGYEVVVVARRVDRSRVPEEFEGCVRAVELPGMASLGIRGLVVGVRRAAAWLRRHPRLGFTAMGWKRALYAQRLKSLLDSLQPDLVHAHFGPHGVDAAIALDGSRTPLIVDFHGFDVTSFPLKHGWALYRGALGNARLVAHSPFVQRVLDENGLAGSVRVVMGVDRRLFGSRPRSERWVPPVRLICVARLYQVKGVDIAINALAVLRASRPDLDVRLHIVGDGPQRDAIRALVESLGVGEFVSGPAAATQPEVADALRQADVALVTSRVMPDGSQEAFSRVAIEAMATGLPIVCTRSGGLPETVGAGGVVASGIDAAAVAEAILVLMSTRGPAEWSERAAQVASSHDIAVMYQGYQALTAELLGGVPLIRRD